jgi:hypothetical protein
MRVMGRIVLINARFQSIEMRMVFANYAMKTVLRTRAALVHVTVSEMAPVGPVHWLLLVTVITILRVVCQKILNVVTVITNTNFTATRKFPDHRSVLLVNLITVIKLLYDSSTDSESEHEQTQ